MRLVSSAAEVWRRGGVGSTDVYPLVAADAAGFPRRDWAADPNGDTRLLLWAKKVKMRRVADLKQNSPEWYSWRRQGVGASEAGAVYGVNPYEAAGDVWAKKVGAAEDKVENADLARGRREEPNARELYEGLYGWKVEPLCALHAVHDFVRCSFDGLRPDGALVVEIKCPRDRTHADALRGNVKPWYFAQVQYQLLIAAAPLAHFVSYCPAWPGPPRERLHVVEVAADRRYQDDLLAKVVEFWGYVEREEPPPGA